MRAVSTGAWGFLVSGLLILGSWAQDTLPDAPSVAGSPVNGASAGGASTNISSHGRAGNSEDNFGYELEPGADPENRLGVPLIKHLAEDQKTFWTSPMRFRKKDIGWAVPFAGATAAFVASDSWVSKQVRPGHIGASRTVSDYAAYSLIGAAGGAFLFGHMTGNDHMSETGFLSGEAALNSTTAAYFIKSITRRPRPFEAGGSGSFFKGGDSFPSEHAAISWSVASVLAHEYPGPLTQLLAYGLASTVSLTRVTGRQHFPSDVIVGSALGWYFGRQVYRAHHDTELGGSAWGDVVPDHYGEEKTRKPENMGSPYVPLDSWVYPALERLIAFGHIRTAYLGIRPWTRLECARMLEEAGQGIDENETGGEAAQIYRELAREFSDELARLNGAPNLGARLDSIYTRVTTVSGNPLRDGYHFGQTITNDYGRPYGEGVNFITGARADAVVGPFALFIQGEYQQAGPVPSVSPQALQAIASTDIRAFGPNFEPTGFSINTGSMSRFRLLDASVSLTLHNIRLSFGQQSNWMGPGESGPLLMSDNALPVTMFKIDNASPFRLPLLSRVLGPVRSEFFLGRLSGATWIYQPPNLYGPNIERQPFIHGTKFSFHPTSNLEFGMGFTAMFAGPGLPFTWGNFLRTFYSHKANLAVNPGKRLSSFDFNYRVPGLRNWMTVYLDSLVVDEYSPIGSSRPSLNPGIYMSHLPKLPKLDLRVEGFKTDHPAATCCFPGSVYWDLRYNSGYTNDGHLMGSWIGRAGYGGQAWSTYSFTPRTKLQLGYRHQEVDRAFIGGGRLNDYSVRGDVGITRQITLSGLLQQEQWNFPVLSAMPRSNTAIQVQMEFRPRWRDQK